MSTERRAVPLIEPESGPDAVVDLPCETGEGPLWDNRRQVLFWQDIPTGRLYRFDPTAGTNTIVYQHNAMIGGTTLQEDGSMILFCSERAIVHLDPDSGKTKVLVDRIPEEASNRFNDVEAAPDGGIFCGTLSGTSGAPAHLYRFAPDGTLTMLFDDIGLSNGIGFSPDRRTMYLSDTNNRRIYRMDYDDTTGSVTNRSILIADHPGEGYPDGMTVDAGGDLWIARWDGRAVYRHRPDGTCVGRVLIPARKVSSIAFGGSDCRDAYVTSALGSESRPEEGELAGSLFRLRLPTRGVPPYRSRIEV
jgi:D-xylonolactonase